MRIDILRTFLTRLLVVHIQQKEKIALEIAAKIASVNGPLIHSCVRHTKLITTMHKSRKSLAKAKKTIVNFPKSDNLFL
jgi:hypothetical protein